MLSSSKRIGTLRRRRLRVPLCEAPNNFRPELNGRRSNYILRKRHDVEIIVEMCSEPAMLCAACDAWMTFAIMADSAKVVPGGISEENIGPEVNGLSQPLKTPTGTRQLGQIHRPLNRHEKIDVLGDGLSGCHGAQKCNASHTRTETCSPHKGICPK